VQDQEGVQPRNSSTLYSLRGSLQSGLSETVSVRFSAAYTRNNFSRLNNGTAIEDPLTALEVGDAFFFTGEDTLPDALDLFLLSEAKEGVDRFTFSSKTTYTPSDRFSSSLTVGLDTRVNEQRILNPREADPLTGFNNGNLTRFNRDFQSVTLEYRGTIDYPREGPVTSKFTFGAQGFREETSIVSVDSETLTPGTEDVGSGGNINADETREEIFNGGIFFKEQVGIKDRLFLNAGVRLDGNSAFGDDVGLQAYPSAGAAYTISEESFWSGAIRTVIPEMRLRVAFGQTGKFPGPFDRDFAFDAVSFRGTPAPRFENPGDPGLKPEVTSTLEGGLESSILDSRLGINFTYYFSRTNDALIFVPEQPVTGQFSQLRNAGTIENQGVELSTDARILRRESIFLSFGASYSWNENELTELDGLLPFNQTDIEGIAQQRVEVGRPVGAWRATTPVDTDGDGLLDSVTDTYPGSTPYPIHTGSFNTSITVFDRVNIFALADWSTGAEILDLSSHWASFNGLERVPRPTEFETQAEAEDARGEGAQPQELGDFRTTESGTFLLQDADFLKIREISVSYSVPERFLTRLGATGGQVSVTARNVWEFTRQEFVDPELAGVNDGAGGVGNAGLQLGGVQSATLSAPRQLRVSLQLKF